MGQFSFILINLPGRSVINPTGKPGLTGHYINYCIIDASVCCKPKGADGALDNYKLQ